MKIFSENAADDSWAPTRLPTRTYKSRPAASKNQTKRTTRRSKRKCARQSSQVPQTLVLSDVGTCCLCCLITLSVNLDQLPTCLRLGPSSIPGVFAACHIPSRTFLGYYDGPRSWVRTNSPFQLEVHDDPPFFVDGTTGFRHLNSVGPSYFWGPHAELVQNDQLIEVFTLRPVAQGLELLIDYGFCLEEWQSSSQRSL